MIFSPTFTLTTTRHGAGPRAGPLELDRLHSHTAVFLTQTVNVHDVHGTRVIAALRIVCSCCAFQITQSTHANLHSAQITLTHPRPSHALPASPLH